MAATERAVRGQLRRQGKNVDGQEPFIAMGELLGAGAQGVFNRVRETFRCIEIAQEEMTRAEREFGHRKDAVRNSFLALMPGGLAGMARELYRSHCRELLVRVVNDRDLRPGTSAEALLALHATSMLAPLTAQAAVLYERLFTEIFGEKARAKAAGGDRRWEEPWPQASDEMLGQLRRRLSRDRVQKDESKEGR